MMRNRCAVPLLTAVLVLGACEAGEEPAREEPRDAPAGEPIEPVAPTPGALTPIDRSDVRGRAGITRAGDDLRVVVEAEGLEPGASYPAHVHQGRCADGGPVRLPLGRLSAGEEGTATLRMRVPADRLPEGPGLFVQVHAPDDRPVACANIEREGG